MKKYYAELDIARALGVIMVLVAHVIRGSEGHWYLEIKIFLFSGFLVCFFFMLGGVFIPREVEKYSFRQFIRTKVVRLFIPAVSIILFYTISNFVYSSLLVYLGEKPFFPHTRLTVIPIKNIALAILYANDSHFIPAGMHGYLYFFSSYFVANIMFGCVLLLNDKSIKYIFLLLLSPTLAYLSVRLVGQQNIPWGISIAFLMMPLMTIGIYYDAVEKKLQSFSKKHPLPFIASTVLVGFCLFKFKWYGGAVHNFNIENMFSFYALAIAGFLWIVSLSLLLAQTFFKTIFVTIGKYTLPIYLFHIFVLDYYLLALRSLGLRRYLLTNYSFITYTVFVVFAIAIIMVVSKYVLRKQKILRRLFLGEM